MTAIIWSPQSVHDLESIRAFIAEDSVRYAELVVARIASSVERLARFPESGRVVPELNRPTSGKSLSARTEWCTDTNPAWWRSLRSSEHRAYFPASCRAPLGASGSRTGIERQG